MDNPQMALVAVEGGRMERPRGLPVDK